MLTRLVLGRLVDELAARGLAGAEFWCLDEARMGLRADLGRSITVSGVKPIGRYRHVYRYFYLFGAINLSTGEHEFMEADAVNTTFFEAFLRQIANVNPMLLKVVVLDNASYHKAKLLKIPANVLLVFLPPYTPELNPIERFWQEVRRPFKGRLFASLDELKDAVTGFLGAFEPRQVRQTVAFPIYKISNQYIKLSCVLFRIGITIQRHKAVPGSASSGFALHPSYTCGLSANWHGPCISLLPSCRFRACTLFSDNFIDSFIEAKIRNPSGMPAGVSFWWLFAPPHQTKKGKRLNRFPSRIFSRMFPRGFCPYSATTNLSDCRWSLSGFLHDQTPHL